MTEADRVKRKEQDRLRLAQLQKEESEEQDRMRLVQLQKEKFEEMEKKAEEKRKQTIFHKMNHQYDSSDSEEGPANQEFEFCQEEQKPEKNRVNFSTCCSAILNKIFVENKKLL